MLEEIAVKYYKQGYNCAETIFMAGIEAYHLDIDPKSVTMMSAFGGGLQCGDLCGCLTGAAAVLGIKYVQTKAHDFSDLRPYTQTLMREFEKVLGARKCVDIKPRLYSKEIKCLNTVRAGAIALENTIQHIENKTSHKF